jgi:hypothetical protein
MASQHCPHTFLSQFRDVHDDLNELNDDTRLGDASQSLESFPQSKNPITAIRYIDNP